MMNYSRVLDYHLAEFGECLTLASELLSKLGNDPNAAYRVRFAIRVIKQMVQYAVTLRNIARAWDFGSGAAVSRCFLTLYQALFYYSLERRPDDVMEFRALVGRLHSLERTTAIHARNHEVDSFALERIATLTRTRAEVIQHPLFASLDWNNNKDVTKQRIKAAKGETPEYVFLCGDALDFGIDARSRTLVMIYLSQFSKGYMLALNPDVEEVNPGSPLAFAMMDQIVNNGLIYFALAIREVNRFFGHVPFSSERQAGLDAWSDYAINGTPTP